MNVERTDQKGRIKRSEFAPVALAALRQLGGRARRKDVLERAERMLPLEDVDREREGPKSHIYWVYMMEKARSQLVRDGLLYPPDLDDYGYWRLTDDGRTGSLNRTND